MSYNKVLLLGNLGKDPEVKTFENDVKKATFSLATSETWKDKQGEKQTRTEWHNIVCWGSLAGLAERYLKKGSSIFIEGKLTSRSWEKEVGTKAYATEVVASDIRFINTNTERTPVASSNTEKIADPVASPAPEDDLPF